MLNALDKQRLVDSGFTPLEAGMIANAKTPGGLPQDTNIDSPAWQATMASRRGYVLGMAKQSWTPGEIVDAIDSYYEQDEATPWDFLKVEYRQVPKLTDFAYATTQRKHKASTFDAKRRIDGHFARYKVLSYD